MVKSMRSFRIALVLGALLSPANGAIAETSCNNLATQLMEIHPGLEKVFTRVNALDPALVLGEKLPRWQDFNDLQDLIVQAHAIRTTLGVGGKLERLDVVIGEFGATVESQGIYQKLANPGPAIEKTYAPTEYDLKTLYQNLVLQLNEQLPTRLRLAVRRIIPDERPAKLKRDAQELVKASEQRFEQLLPTSGHQSLGEFRTAYGQGELQQKLLTIMAEERFQMTMRRPENARWWVPKVGFQNLFVTGSSKGYYTPTGRNHVEAGWTGEKFESYEKLDNELKPKYGSFRVNPEEGLKPANGDASYGSDIYILKKDRLRDRTTFNYGDSNGRIAQGTGSGWENRTHTATAWDQMFIPYSHREMLAPFMESGAKAGLGNRPTLPSESTLKTSWAGSLPYFEIQVFGQVTLEDVEMFEFKGTPPSGEFLAELQRHKIKIVDGSTWPPTPWTPPAT